MTDFKVVDMQDWNRLCDYFGLIHESDIDLMLDGLEDLDKPSEYERQVSELQDEVNDLEFEREELEVKVNDLELERDEARDKADEYKADLISAENEIDDLNEELAKCKGTYA